MTLYVHRAERADRLVAALGDLLADPLPDAFATEVVAVPARGVERWVTQRLSHRLGGRSDREDGICAGVRFPSPRELVAQVVGVDDHDPWAPDSLVWPLLEVVDESVGETWCQTLGTHLGAGESDAVLRDSRRGRRYAVARRLAGLFDSYATMRPQLLTAWAADDDSDGFGRRLPADLRWQPELWRRVARRVGSPHPVERLAHALQVVRARPETLDLPERLSLFGPTRLPASQVEALAALAEHRDVHLWLPHPSPVLWTRLRDLGATGDLDFSAVALRRSDPTVLVPRHPLLSSLGRDSRELQLALSRLSTEEVHHPSGDEPSTLLGLLQRDLRDDHRADPATRCLAPDDRSLQVHACHGPARQVGVLREVLVGLLAADDTLEPRDVLVMCPDIEVYAPLVAAAFGLADVVTDGHPAHRLRVRLADRALRRTNPLLATVATLLEMAEGRVTGSQVLGLAASEPVRRRFRFDDDDLEQLGAWVAQAGVRWGFDAPHRQPFGLAAFGQNTWRAGLDRILVGAAMADEDQSWLGLALPLDDVGSGDIDRAGRLAELLDRLQRALDSLTGERLLRDWLVALAEAAQSLTSVADADQWQWAGLHRELADVADAAGARVDSTSLRLADVRALLAARLGGRPTRANFRTGTLTVCTMVPMRSVPHRVVCLLGLDDGVFPRGVRVDGDDVLAREPAVGERDPRGEDRQLMLDALLAATERVVITYTGADERSGAERPPAVPLGELLDALDDTATTESGRPAREQVLVRHPLQPFDVCNLTPGALGTKGPFSYDPAALAGARAATGARHAPQAFVPAPLPPAPRGDIDLASLSAFLQHPVGGFLRQRLEVTVRRDEDVPSDALAVELDALETWAVGERLLGDRLAGVDEDTCRQAEWRRGALPPGPLGGGVLENVLEQVRPLVDGTTQLREGLRRTVDVQVEIGAGRRVVGTVTGLYDSRLVHITYSKLSAKHRLRAWVSLLALAAGHAETGWTAVVVGRDGPAGAARSVLGPLDPEPARAVLEQLVDLYDRGLREPVPLAAKTSAEYAQARTGSRSVDDASSRAGRRWRTGNFPGEDADPAHVQVWGKGLTFDDLTAAQPGGDETWAGEPSRFGELALRLWAPLLSAERLGPL